MQIPPLLLRVNDEELVEVYNAEDDFASTTCREDDNLFTYGGRYTSYTAGFKLKVAVQLDGTSVLTQCISKKTGISNRLDGTEDDALWTDNDQEAGYYYFAILTDLALRFGWTLSVSLTELGVIHSDLMVTILAPLEVFRRFVWNFFRLENEHLNNCGKFRAVRDISVAPIDAGNQALLVRMMDEPCGVINRGGAARRDLRKRANKHKKSSLETKVLLEESDDVVDV
ncbi:solute carrier family 53 member 1-like [Haemaphysalis longicornis]